MKVKIIFLSFLLALMALLDCMGQTDSIPSKSFPSGEPIVRIFANFHHGITPSDRSAAFEARRVYLGYKADLDDYFSTEVKVDIGSPDDVSEFSRLRRYAYFKTAAIYWTKNQLTLKGGIIDTEHYRRQEKYWKHRYLYRSMQDEHGFGPKADLGATILYSPGDFISLDASMMNGEGYKNLQRDEKFKYSLAISVFPISPLIIRVYYDIISKDVNQSTFSTFAGYRVKKLTGGAEYNIKFNRDHQQDHNQYGISAYLSYDLNERFEVFGRFDRLSSNVVTAGENPWNLVDDGSAIIGGIQFRPIEQVKLALNYQDWLPYASNQGNLAYIFLNLEVNL